MRSSEKNHYKNLLTRNKNNLTKLWTTLNQVINKKKRKQIYTSFKYMNSEITKDMDIANYFNEYFLNVTKDLSDKIPSHSKDPCFYMKGKAKNSIFFSPTTEDEILEIISKLKNSSAGYDNEI